MMEEKHGGTANMNLENMAYTCFGNNLVVGKHIKKQLSFLQSILPAELVDKEMDDLGCGDGKVTVLLKDILKPSRMRGFDIHQGNVRRAINRGIEAGSINLDNEVPHGELAVIWGVLHHLQNPERCIKKLKDNYSMLLIREPVKTGMIKGLELGNPMKLKDLISMFDSCLPDYRIHRYDNSVIVFSGCEDYQKKAYTPVMQSELHSNADTKSYRETSSDDRRISEPV